VNIDNNVAEHKRPIFRSEGKSKRETRPNSVIGINQEMKPAIGFNKVERCSVIKNS